MDEREAAVREQIGGMIRDQVIWGASYALIGPDGQKLYYQGAQGCAPPFDSRPVLPRMRYDLASLTKVVGTCVRILQLMEEGLLTLDTPVHEILEEFHHKEITVGNLLLHDSGLPAEIPDKGRLTRENILACLYRMPAVCAPGREYLYSDVGFILLGLIVSRLDRSSLEDSFQRHIFEPLHMEHTSYRTEGPSELYIPTECTKERGCIHGVVHDSKAFLLGQSGSAGLFSTLEDLAVFVHEYLRESPGLFRRKETYRLVRGTVSRGRTYGFSKEYGKDTLYHTGFTGVSLLMDLSRGEGFVLLTNRIHPDRDNEAFLERRGEVNRLFMETGA